MNEISTIEDVAKQAAVRGGQILMDYFCHKNRIWAKSPFEIVTEADIASEKAVISEIRLSYPSHAILTEEQGELAGDTDHIWIVDPLDGTLKFVLGEPYFSVSIAYELRGVVEIAVVHNPYTKDMYFACRGKGAFKNNVALKVSAIEDLADTFVCCDWGGSLAMQQQGLGYLFRLLPPATRGVGVNFSPALDLCNLAEGIISAMIGNGTTTEDHSAGALIVREAGGSVANFGQLAWSHRTQGIVATNTPNMASKIAGLLKDCLK